MRTRTAARRHRRTALRTWVLLWTIVAATTAVPRGQSPADPQFRYGATVDLPSFQYRRTIAASRPGVTELTLDAAALAHCNGEFADLRVVAPDGRQIPYLVEKASDPLSVRLPPLEHDTSRPATSLRRPHDERNNAGSRGRVSRYLVRLPFAHLPPARLVLETTARVFEREVWLEIGPGAGSDRPDGDWRVVASLWWAHADPGSAAAPLTFEFGSLATSVLHLAVDEGDNAALPLERVTLLLPAYRVRFVRPATSLQLVYGDRRLEPPRYDLALEARALLDATAEHVSVGPEQTRQPGGVPPGIIFWSALALAVVVLFGLVVKLLRREA